MPKHAKQRRMPSNVMCFVITTAAGGLRGCVFQLGAHDAAAQGRARSSSTRTRSRTAATTTTPSRCRHGAIPMLPAAAVVLAWPLLLFAVRAAGSAAEVRRATFVLICIPVLVLVLVRVVTHMQVEPGAW